MRIPCFGEILRLLPTVRFHLEFSPCFMFMFDEKAQTEKCCDPGMVRSYRITTIGENVVTDPAWYRGQFRYRDRLLSNGLVFFVVGSDMNA